MMPARRGTTAPPVYRRIETTAQVGPEGCCSGLVIALGMQYAVIAAFDSRCMATLTVRSLDDEIVRRLRIRAAEHGRSAEAEHREILRIALIGHSDRQMERQRAADRLAEFRRRTAGRGSPTAAELLQETRASRLTTLSGPQGDTD